MNGERLASWWVTLLARGLPEEVRAERSAEITSDVWEQLRDLGPGRRTQLAILSRCVRGLPADLAWRCEQLVRQRGRARATGSLVSAVAWASAAASYVILVGLFAAAATALLGIDLLTGEEDDVLRAARLGLALLVPLVLGPALLRPLPVVGAVALTCGGLGAPLAFGWAAPLFAPSGFAVAAAGVVLARRRRAGTRAAACTAA